MTTFLVGAALGLGIGYVVRRRDHALHEQRMGELRRAFHSENGALAALMRREGLSR